MAESSPVPALPSTADPTPYVPISWMAVAALAVSVAFALALLGFGVVAFTNKKPLLEDWLLAMPAIAIVLSFAARRVIRNSEGTRTGEKLAVTAWWMALILGLCYIAYLFAIDYAIRRDARGEAEKWFGSVNKGGEDDIASAFYRTVPPGERNFAPNDIREMNKRFRDPFAMFRASDLVRLAQRNKGELTFAPTSVTWSYKPGMIDGTVTGAAKCAEGTFPVVLPLKGLEGVKGTEGGGGGRQWMINPPRGGGFIDLSRVTRTPYGWMVVGLEETGNKFGREFVNHVAPGPMTHAFAYRAFVAEGGDAQGWGEVARDARLHLIFAAPARAAGDAGYREYMDKSFYRLPGGAEPPPDQKSRFFNSWNLQSLRPAGEKIKTPDGNPIDKESILVTDSAVEVRVPAEVPIPGSSNNARARVVVLCKDPAILSELKQLRSSANPDQGTARPPADLIERVRKATWRVGWVESDMQPVNVNAGRGPGGPGGPEMPEG